MKASAAVAAFLLCLLNGTTMAAEPQWRLYPEGGLRYTLLRNGQVYLNLEVVSWGPNWKWFSFGRGTEQAADGRRSFASNTAIGGTNINIHVAHSAAQTADNRIALDYELSAPQPAELTQIVVSVAARHAAFSGGKCLAVSPSGERNEVPLPFGRGSVGESVESLIFVDRAGNRSTLKIEPPRPVSMDGDGRIQLVGSSIGSGEPRRTRIILVLPSAATFYPDREQTLQRTDTSDWFPYPVGPEGVPIDLSFLNKDEAGSYVPAGSHGFLKVDGDRFVFEDGTPARFWGLNITAGAALGPPERAEQLAERLARLGCNIARLHHLDSWANPIIDYDHADGTTQHLSPEGMRALDKTVYELKRHGIHVVLDPWVQRCFKEADGVADYGNVGRRGNFNLHPYVYFDPRMQELVRKQWEQVWTHVNEFTGLAYKDDPAVVMTEIINEGLLTGLSGVKAPYYRRQILERYSRWAECNDGAPADGADIFNVNYGENNLHFFTDVHRTFYGHAHKFFRRLGLRIPINATNWAHFTWVMAAQTDLDFMDSHHYYGGDQIGPGHGLGGLWLSHPPGLPGAPFGKIAGFAVAGKPVASSECGNNPPKTYRAAYQIGLAAVAAFQGWDSITGYAYSQSDSPRDTLSAFEWETDPASIAAVAVGALLFRRGDVSPARQTVIMEIPGDELWTLRWQDGGARQYWNTAGFNCAIEQHKVLVALPGQPLDDLRAIHVLTPEWLFQYEPPNTELASDTGELWRDWKLGVGTIDTARTQAAYGMLGKPGRQWRTRHCTFDISTPFALAALSSLTDDPIADSNRMLLTAVARAENTGTAANLAGNALVERGGPPVIAEPVVGNIRLRTSRHALVMHPVQADGTRGLAVELPIRDGVATIELKPSFRTIFYEVEAAR